MIPVILSGGAGTRLWPLSRQQYPKQFLPLVSDQTMIQETVLRLKGMRDISAPLVVCNEEQRFIVAEQLRQIDHQPESIILEPVARNTAPALAVAALAVDPDALLLVLPADHVITEIQVFQDAIKQARQLAEQDYLVSFGITQDKAETGYGYIRYGQAFDGAFEVAEFVEKPDKATAESYLAEGNYVWNSGMFVFKAKRYLGELEKFNPDILKACQHAFKEAKRDMNFIRLGKPEFANSPSDSIEYAVMEKTEKSLVLPLSAGWNDIGSWSALWQVANKDDQHNVSKGDVLALDCHNSYFYADNKMIAAIGLNNVVVVETDDVLMVADKNQVHRIKTIVEQLQQANRCEVKYHRKVYRPWGYYVLIDASSNFQTKRVVINSGAKLSLQKHHDRAEHWVVVKGTAQVTRGDETLLLSENQSTYIPLGTVHRLANAGVIPLEIIEVQSGSYLGEDDIIRYQDDYGRNKE